MVDEERIRRLRKWKKGEKQPPFELEIRPTDNCNLSCRTCPQSDVEPDNEVSDHTWRKVASQLESFNIAELTVCGGGEPLTRKDTVLKLLEASKKSGASGRLITNGTLFEKRDIKKFIDMGWDTIMFSVNAPDASTDNFLRNSEEAFQKSISSIKTFQIMKRRLDSQKPGIVLAPVLSNKNHRKILEFIELAKNLGVESVIFQLLQKNTEFCDKIALKDSDMKTLRENIEKASERAQEFGINFNGEKFLDEKTVKKTSEKSELIESDLKKTENDGFTERPCFSPWSYMVINPNGLAQPCPNLGEERGDEDIRNKSLKEIWHSEYFSKFRERIANSELFSCCDKCCGNKIFDVREARKELSK